MKLGLIAISGIRAWDKELMDFGLTLPGFVERSEVVASLPSLWLLTLAGMTPPHHQIEYSEIRDLDEPVSASDRFDLVAISSFTAQIKEAYALADSYRSRTVEREVGLARRDNPGARTEHERDCAVCDRSSSSVQCE